MSIIILVAHRTYYTFSYHIYQHAAWLTYVFRITNVLIPLNSVIFVCSMSFQNRFSPLSSWRRCDKSRNLLMISLIMTFIDLSVYFKMLLKMEYQYFIFVTSLLIMLRWFIIIPHQRHHQESLAIGLCGGCRSPLNNNNKDVELSDDKKFGTFCTV